MILLLLEKTQASNARRKTEESPSPLSSSCPGGCFTGFSFLQGSLLGESETKVQILEKEPRKVLLPLSSELKKR